jgi:hypothetical protein
MFRLLQTGRIMRTAKFDAIRVFPKQEAIWALEMRFARTGGVAVGRHESNVIP